MRWVRTCRRRLDHHAHAAAVQRLVVMCDDDEPVLGVKLDVLCDVLCRHVSSRERLHPLAGGAAADLHVEDLVVLHLFAVGLLVR